MVLIKTILSEFIGLFVADIPLVAAVAAWHAKIDNCAQYMLSQLPSDRINLPGGAPQ